MTVDVAERPADRSWARRAAYASLLRALLTTASLVWLYFVVPVKETPSGSVVALLLVGLVVLSVLLTWQVRSITRSRTPRLRALEALATVVPFFLLLFALFYYVLAFDNTSEFSQQLSRVDALYFTVTTFATVGFGDIVAVSETARVAVTVQMISDLLLIGAGLRVLLRAVQVGLTRQDERPSTDGVDEGPLTPSPR